MVLATNNIIKHVLRRLGLQNLICLHSPNDAHTQDVALLIFLAASLCQRNNEENTSV
jgi:hypothetical protein